MAALDKEKKSNRLLGSRRYTHDVLNDAQEAFTEVLDIGASEVYTHANLIPEQNFFNYKTYPYQEKSPYPSLWSQMGVYGLPFLDTPQGQDFREGFMDENIIGILWNAFTNDEKYFQPDDNYNWYEDEKYSRHINNNPDWFRDSRSIKETEFLIKKLEEEKNRYRDPFWSTMGMMGGGITDISSVFFFQERQDLCGCKAD